jgi:hypothetical protein
MIITGKSDDEHLQNLENVFQRLQYNGLLANTEKVFMFTRQRSLMWT